MNKTSFRRMSVTAREELFFSKVIAPIIQTWINKVGKSGETVHGLGEDDLIRLKAKVVNGNGVD